MPSKEEKKEEIPAEKPKEASKKKEPYVYIYKPEGGTLPPKGKFNKWTGDYHDKNSNRTFPEGNPVVGCNKWIQTEESIVLSQDQTTPIVSEQKE